MSGLWLSLYAAPAALGFALFFNVRRRTLVPIALLAVAAHLLRNVLMRAGVDLVAASFVASFLTGSAAYILGPRTGEASPVFAFAPVIPLVPGALMFEGLQAAAEVARSSTTTLDDAISLTRAGQRLLTAMGVVLALAFGAAAPSLFRLRQRRAYAAIPM